ncbi:uncharacterized protein LOC111352161 [Spodoptera litura]|uniref:Uncharacterized protein LOC111352161 n=1 Tax=Spodoptera litura TaxID=69820 RepID=A0A9J7IR61_SPOLT|nr:uncharacterized protein LOC111352161 [Spodoptera litura]
MSKIQDISSFHVTTYSRYNISESTSDIQVFVNEFKKRIECDLRRTEENAKENFITFAEKRLSISDITWLQDNYDRFFKDTENKTLIEDHYLSECGFICSMAYSPDGETIIVGHSTGLIQMRHGSTGTVLCTLRNIQFPPKPVHALEYSSFESNVCYAACIDGAVYRIEIPEIDTSIEEPPTFCIRADPMLESLNMQFYGSPGTSLYATPFVTQQRGAALSLGVMSECKKMAVGYADTSIKIYNMETQEADVTYKVHKLRLQFIPKKLQRMHYGQVVALRAHPQKPFLFASGAWDKTLRIWDIRCQVGCVMTFEGVDICSDAIDLNREHVLAGSWLPTDGVSVWDLTARKLLSFIKVQNRRPDVDGEYVYACRYWRSYDYNRKGKYALVGGSGTNSLEVINLHNRYITCSYPSPGTILAVTSYQERIAFAGTSSAFTIASFYDPKLQKEKYQAALDADYDYSKPAPGTITLYHDDVSMYSTTDQTPDTDMPESPSSTGTDTTKSS